MYFVFDAHIFFFLIFLLLSSSFFVGSNFSFHFSCLPRWKVSLRFVDGVHRIPSFTWEIKVIFSIIYSIFVKSFFCTKEKKVKSKKNVESFDVDGCAWWENFYANFISLLFSSLFFLFCDSFSSVIIHTFTDDNFFSNKNHKEKHDEDKTEIYFRTIE